MKKVRYNESGENMNEFDKLYLADFEELSLYECGKERCQPGKVIQLDIKDYHLFHYILAGSGTFIFEDKVYHLKKGDIFYIPPKMTAKYFPSNDNPWVYTWIGFGGTRADKYLKRMDISATNPIYHDNKENELKPLFNELAEKYMRTKYLNIETLAIFMNIMYKMMIAGHRKEIMLTAKETHIKMTKQFIENNFQFKLKVTDIASALSISPNYLANIFKEELNSSPKEMLTNYRMMKAMQLLTETKKSIKDIALSVGYENALHFSAEFKRVKKVSPKLYRYQNTHQE